MGHKAKRTNLSSNKTRKNRQKTQERKRRRDCKSLEWKSEIFKFRNQLKPFGLTIREIIGDGNCLFRAISDQMTGSQEMHETYRAQAVEFMCSNQVDFAPFIEDDKTFDNYIKEMSKSATWGGNLELQALSMALGVNIRIHMLNAPIWEIMNFNVNEPTIHLSYHEGDHYNSVRLSDDTGDNPAVQIPRELRIVKTSEEITESVWQDAVEFTQLLSSDMNEVKILAVLKKLFPEAPSIDVINESAGKILNELVKANSWELPTPEQAKPSVQSISQPPSKNSKPSKLPKPNEKCWCGSSKKYNKCCRAKDAFRDPEPERISQSLESLRI